MRLFPTQHRWSETLWSWKHNLIVERHSHDYTEEIGSNTTCIVLYNTIFHSVLVTLLKSLIFRLLICRDLSQSDFILQRISSKLREWEKFRELHSFIPWQSKSIRRHAETELLNPRNPCGLWTARLASPALESITQISSASHYKSAADRKKRRPSSAIRN